MQNYSRWFDAVNYAQITHKWYAQHFLFPFNLMQCNRRRADVESLLRIQYPNTSDDIIEKIRAAATALSPLQ